MLHHLLVPPGDVRECRSLTEDQEAPERTFRWVRGQSPSWELPVPLPCPTFALCNPTPALGGTRQAQLEAGAVKPGTLLGLGLTLVEQERAGLAGMNWRHAGTDGRSTAEPGRPVLLFQQCRARAGVPPDFPSQAPGLMLRELQWGLPAQHPPGPARSPGGAKAPEEGARTPRGTRQEQEALEGGACSPFCREQPGAERLPCASCLPGPHPEQRGAPKAWGTQRGAPRASG